MSRKTRLYATNQQIAASAIAGAGDDVGLSFTGENHPAALPEGLANNSKAFKAAAQAIDAGSSEEAGQGTPFGSQTGNAAVWANENGKLIPDSFFHDLVVISEATSEHKVYFRQSDRRAVKKTWAGVYGQVPSPNNGKLDRKNATPAEYLRRMSFQIEIFGSDFKLEGVSVSDEPSMIIGQPSGQPSFVISQCWLEKSGTAKNEDITAYLEEEGFASVPDSYFGWYRSADSVVIVDAKPDNFIKTAAGLVPIDLQIAVFSEDQVIEAGLREIPATNVIIRA